jgi:PIN domain nuclease of toxin-antitoxin system
VTYLLDTHAFVWAITSPGRLGAAAREAITDPTTTLLVSAVTALELATKVRLGKFTEAEPLVAQYEDLVARLGASHLAIEPSHALRAGTMPWSHRDPFDRLLAAQSMLTGFPLVTRDDRFNELDGLHGIW